jgi:hemerythrin-like metal-binding protein
LSPNWSPDLEIGHREIDMQHRRLIETIDALRAAIEGDRDIRLLNEIIDQLDRYVRIHFAYEEKQLRLARYPQLNEHIDEHRRFARKLTQLSEPVRRGETWPAPVLLRWLTDWTCSHIRLTDKKCQDWLTGERWG